MKRLLVGMDGSRSANRAVAWAAEVCQATGAELIVASARPTGQSERYAADEATARLAAEAAMEVAVGELAGDAGVTFSTRLLEGDPREALVRAAIVDDADLVAVGSVGESGPLSFGLGSVANHLLHHLDRPVAAVPAMGGPLGGGRIVVGVDGSTACQPALEWAVELAADAGATLTAVFAYDPMADSYPHPAIDNWRYRGEDAVRAQIDRARRSGADLRLVMVGDRPERALADMAEEQHAAAIVIGTRGRGGFHGLVIGRVPVRVVSLAPCPVVVVRH